jgi:hypothetical protein
VSIDEYLNNLMASYLTHYKAFLCKQLKVEFSLIKVQEVWVIIVAGLLMNYVHMMMHSLVFYVASGNNKNDEIVGGGPDNRLVDLGFNWLPEYHTRSDGKGFAPSNVLLYTVMAIAVFFVVYPLFFKCYYTTVQILWRILHCMIFTILARVLSFITTILPSPAKHCSPANWDPPTLAQAFYTVRNYAT